MKDIRRKYSPTINLSKLTSNKKILSGIDIRLQQSLLPDFINFSPTLNI